MCDFCTKREQLDSVSKEFILDRKIDIGFLGTLHESIIILPDEKAFDICTVHALNRSIISEEATHVPIKFCPMCGREL